MGVGNLAVFVGFENAVVVQVGVDGPTRQTGFAVVLFAVAIDVVENAAGDEDFRGVAEIGPGGWGCADGDVLTEAAGGELCRSPVGRIWRMMTGPAGRPPRGV